MEAHHPISVLIADDHPVYRRGLRDIIEEDGRFAIVAECADGEEVLAAVSRLEPRIVILDIEMPRLSGLETASVLMKKANAPILLFLTMHDTGQMFERAMELGALGYILKDEAMIEIIQGIDAVLGGDRYCSPALAGRLTSAPPKGNGGTANVHLALSRLTPAERRVLRLIAENRSTEEIADALFISPRTVEGHRGNISHKLGLSGSYALVRFALQNRNYL